MTYTQVSASGLHTALIRSDGTAVICGHDALKGPFVRGAPFLAWLNFPNFVVQLSYDGTQAVCHNMCGEQLASWVVPDTDRSRQVKRCIEQVLAPAGCCKIGVVLPDGRLVNPRGTWQDLL